MAQDLERIQARLDNIRSVGPILAALRTISLGSWQMALNRVHNLRRYSERLLGFLPVVLPRITPRTSSRALYRVFAPLGASKRTPEESKRRVALIVGSERGLCGRYNATIFEQAEPYLIAAVGQGVEVEWGALGTRMVRTFQRQEWPLQWSQPLPVTRLPPFDLAHTLTRDWLLRYEAYEIDAVDVLYNAYTSAGRYTPTTIRLLPPQQLPTRGQVAVAGSDWAAQVIVETDPMRLYARVMTQWMAVGFYSLLLSAAASEHSARFHLMESATQNADRLTEELTLELQSARRQAITREMQELAAGAGLLGT